MISIIFLQLDNYVFYIVFNSTIQCHKYRLKFLFYDFLNYRIMCVSPCPYLPVFLFESYLSVFLSIRNPIYTDRGYDTRFMERPYMLANPGESFIVDHSRSGMWSAN